MTTLITRLRDAILGAKTDDSHGTAPALRIAVRCARCGERIVARVEKAYELQEIYPDRPPAAGDEEHAVGYVLTKELVGAQCQNTVRLTFTFDARRQIVKQCIVGGTVLATEECG